MLSPARAVAEPPVNQALGHRTLRALGTEVTLEGADVDRAAAELLRLEALLTRFAPSPLTRLNAEGVLLRPPPELVAALRHALDVARRSGGLVTPMVLPALREAGYRDPWPAPARPGSGEPAPLADWRGVHLAKDRIALPFGAEVDLGGTAKSWIAERLSDALGAESLVDAGGDIVVRSGAGTAVDVEDVSGSEPSQLLLPPGRWGVATSSVRRRAWPGGHHLIDPRTARPALTRFVQATVVHPSLCEAEVLAKLALFEALPAAPAAANMILAQDAEGVVWRHAPGGWFRT
jgi:thiamine biosynthesis lipoprotein